MLCASAPRSSIRHATTAIFPSCVPIFKNLTPQITQKRSVVRKVIFAAGFPRNYSKKQVEYFFRSRLKYVKFVRVLRDITCYTGFDSTGIALVRFTRTSAASRCTERFDGKPAVPGHVLTIRYTLEETIEDHKKVGNLSFLFDSNRLEKVNKMMNPIDQPVSTTLYVTSLPTMFNELHVRDLFKKFGEIVSVRKQGKGTTFAHVTFEKPSSAKRALKTLHGCQLKGRALKLRYAYHRQDREAILGGKKLIGSPQELLKNSPVYQELVNDKKSTPRFSAKKRAPRLWSALKPDLGNIIVPNSSLKLPGVNPYSSSETVRAPKTYNVENDPFPKTDQRVMEKFGLDADMGNKKY